MPPETKWRDGLFPDDPDYCAQEWADSPWCEGPSMRECPQGIEVPETDECGTAWQNDTDALDDPYESTPTMPCVYEVWDEAGDPVCVQWGYPEEHWEQLDPSPENPYEHEQTTRGGSCELEGTCDDSCSPPARSDCMVAVPSTPAAPEMLPQTGISDNLLIIGSVLLFLGVMLLIVIERKDWRP